MKIKSIYIEKYKGFKEFNIDFNNNVIIGENGLGKTTILELIYDMIIGNDDIVDGNDFKECSIKALFNDEELNIIKELSGEKQIFFRGGSLLEMNLNNSITLIDEPELSLHPEWQQKILDFYKGIGENNQIIIATHYPHKYHFVKKKRL